MLDSIKSSDSCQPQYIQIFPRFLCRNARRFQEISQAKGFACKCRDPRCSFQCHANWAQKQAACLARHLHDFPEELKTYRGNLTLPAGATPEIHTAVRERFLQRLRRWKAKSGIVAEIHATTHALSPVTAHYDFVAFSEAKGFRSVLRDLWVESGGLRATCLPIHDEELDATAKYQKKVSSNKEEKETLTHTPPKLLNSRKISGLDTTWHTRSSKSSEGFWRGTSVDEIWAILCEEWHPHQDEDELILARAISRAEAGLPPKPVRQPDPDPLPAVYFPGNDLRHDAWVFAEKMPHSPLEAVGASAYGDRWGVDGTYMLQCFELMPGAVRLDGELVNGRLISNAWYIHA